MSLDLSSYTDLTTMQPFQLTVSINLLLNLNV